jgi:hypothetical protein
MLEVRQNNRAAGTSLTTILTDFGELGVLSVIKTCPATNRSKNIWTGSLLSADQNQNQVLISDVLLVHMVVSVLIKIVILIYILHVEWYRDEYRY